MAKSFKISTNTIKHQVRSISLPSRLHPTTTRVTQELNKFKTWEASYVPTEASICNDLTRLTELYKRVDDVLNMSMTQKPFFRHKDEKWVEELFEGSIKLLDMCGVAKDIVGKIKEQVRELHCNLRRRKGYSIVENSVADYISLRKKIKKEAKRLTGDLKQTDNANGNYSLLDQDQHLAMAIKVLKEVSEMTISVIVSLFFLLNTKPKSYRWSMVSKMMQNGRDSCEEEEGNVTELEKLDSCEEEEGNVTELEKLDVALLNLCKDESSNFKGVVQKRLEAMEGHLEGIDSGLDCIFRGLIRTRSLLLNIISH